MSPAPPRPGAATTGANDDAALLEAARGGDRSALEALLERHQAQIYRFGLKLCRDPDDAQDVLQDTMIAMARGVRDFRGTSSLATWLYTIARSFCIKKRRRGKFAPAPAAVTSLHDDGLASGDQLTDAASTPVEALASKQVEAALEAAIRALEPMYREVLVLRDVEGLSAAEVADVLELSTAAVKSRLHRARIAVRQHIAPLLGLPAEPAEPADAATAAAASTGACPDVLTMYSKHLEGEINAEVCIQMERHLEGCPRCRDTCDSLKHTLALCQTQGRQATVPPTVQRAVKRALQDFLRDAG